MIALVKARPGQINYASSGAGGAPHLAAELFNSLAGVKMVHIAYKGSGPSFIDVLGGQVPLTMDSLTQGLPYVKSGRLRAVATLGPVRTPVLPEVPTVGETLKGYEVVNWFGLVAPAATPRDVINRLHGEIVKILRMPDIKERMLSQGATPKPTTPQAFDAFIREEVKRFAAVIIAAGARIN